MATTIEEIYNNAIQLFHSYYVGGRKNETIEIPDSVLRKHGFETDFWNRLCPELREAGILKFVPIRFFTNTRVADKDQEKSNYLFEKALKLQHDSSLSSEKKFANEDALDKEFRTIEHFFKFVVDGKKLEEAYAKNITAGDEEDPRDANRKTASYGYSQTSRELKLGERRIHKFHKGPLESLFRKLFYRKELYDRRGKKVVTEGKYQAVNELIVDIELAESVMGYSDPEIKEKFRLEQAGLESLMANKKMNFELKEDVQDGVSRLLLVEFVE